MKLEVTVTIKVTVFEIFDFLVTVTVTVFENLLVTVTVTEKMELRKLRPLQLHAFNVVLDLIRVTSTQKYLNYP